MGNRLSKIVTRTGDDGTTGLGDGSRVAKDSPRIAAIGDIDETNCTVGVVLATLAGPTPLDATLVTSIGAALATIQHDLFRLGGEVATPGMQLMTMERLLWLEAQLEAFNSALPPLTEFVLPGGSVAAAACHVARATCRRAERSTWALSRRESVRHECLLYLNRLSDLLFVLCRVLARAAAGTVPEPLWNHRRGE